MCTALSSACSATGGSSHASKRTHQRVNELLDVDVEPEVVADDLYQVVPLHVPAAVGCTGEDGGQGQQAKV